MLRLRKALRACSNFSILHLLCIFLYKSHNPVNWRSNSPDQFEITKNCSVTTNLRTVTVCRNKVHHVTSSCDCLSWQGSPPHKFLSSWTDSWWWPTVIFHPLGSFSVTKGRKLQSEDQGIIETSLLYRPYSFSHQRINVSNVGLNIKLKCNKYR